MTVRLFGTSEFAVRLPSLIAGVALVPSMCWVGRVLYDRRTGWVAAVLAAIAPFGVWYSQEARMYSLFMLVRGPRDRRPGAGAAPRPHGRLGAVRRGDRALLWTQYFAVLPILVQQLAFAWVVLAGAGAATPSGAACSSGLGSSASPSSRWSCCRCCRSCATSSPPTATAASGLTPGQAGAGSSTLGGTISIYAVGANLIWALFGYHADGAMVQIAALWPLLMLLALVMLGRGRSGPSLLLLALVVVPMAALFVVGSLKRDLFELRYFSGAVPAMLLLAARVVTATTVRRAPLVVARAVLTAVLVVGLVDQQLNGANPRLYDFKGAFAEIERARRAGRRRAVRAGLPRRGRRLLRAGLEARGRSARAVPDGDRHGVRARHRAGARRRRHVGPARHRARRARATARHRRRLRAPERPRLGAA